MTFVDDQGRVFGRFNLVDFTAGFVLIALIPLGYAAYVLFRVPPPRLVAVDPPALQLSSAMRVTIHGENLRPYMRVSLDNNQTREFLFKDATTAEVTFADIPVGTYDVVLYDFAQERSRLPKAFTIAPPVLPVSKVHVAGFLTGVPQAMVPRLIPGYEFPAAGKVLKVGPPASDIARIVTGDHFVEMPIEKTVRVPVLVEVLCAVQTNSAGLGECRSVPGPAVGPGAYITMPTFDSRQPLLIVDVYPPIDPTVIDVRVHITGQDDAMQLARAGDPDTGVSQNPFANGAVVAAAPSLATRELALKIPAFPSLNGWQYAGQLVRVGSTLTFQSPRYVISGVVTSAPALPAASGGGK